MFGNKIRRGVPAHRAHWGQVIPHGRLRSAKGNSGRGPQTARAKSAGKTKKCSLYGTVPRDAGEVAHRAGGEDCVYASLTRWAFRDFLALNRMMEARTRTMA